MMLVMDAQKHRNWRKWMKYWNTLNQALNIAHACEEVLENMWHLLRIRIWKCAKCFGDEQHNIIGSANKLRITFI